ncbi:SPOR domain-containing protein [Sandaracinobacteroides hominis]|uniref:SPOR domain-containing protein n=1 Tax=Sandaracinobacteroides hominis TaxID=2780086 RepID=UPI0018F3F83F|nr:SPOR domain-containing protein [Sandaracinobacteroides hominis]
MAPRSPSRGPSPREDASRRNRGWEDEPAPRRARRQEPDDAPWLDEGDFEEEGPTHTLVGRRAFWGMMALLAILTIGVIVGIMLVSKRETTPIDVPGVGEQVPVLSSPGPWKVAPSGPDVDGVPVEGQGQVLFGTGDGRDPEAAIALDAMPEDPLPRPVAEPEPVPETVIVEGEPKAEPAPIPAKPVVAAPPPAKPRIAEPKMIVAPEPEPRASGNGSTLQLGAFSSESRARAAFKSLTDRYRYLAGFEPVILPTASDGKTLYRLRTSAASPAEARDICGRLKVAGEACSVVG